jgi:putative ABC transport system permease protein
MTRDPELTSLFEVELPFVFNGKSDSVASIEKLLAKVGRVPGIAAASYSSGGPKDNMICTYEVAESAGVEPRVTYGIVSFVGPAYFDTVGATLLRDHAFVEGTNKAPRPTAIVDETLAKRAFPRSTPIGRHLLMTVANKQFEVEIVGVSPHLNFYGIDDPEWIQPQVYLPLRETPPDLVPAVLSQGKLVLRTSKPLSGWKPIITPQGDDAISSVSKIVQTLDPQQSFSYAKSIELIISVSTAPKYLSLYVLVTFAGLSILLALVSIRSLVAYTVDQRDHEIAIRMALGAKRSQLYRLVAAKAVRLLLIGSIIGIGIALLLHLMVFRYQERQAWNLSELILIALLFATAALAACYGSARRVMLIDPNKLLRAQ